ncbi:8475_t:CDS:2 [Entrophospora sp. SA101]|nr:4250_t:CDS:2 [Entrophospora sp. SA101]CAJ0759321.1 8475_t:CDS:2 [Entrophospora sp. SA101]
MTDVKQQQTAKKNLWLPLESNPDVMNEYIHKLGVSNSWAYTDVWVKAVLLLFPITENHEKYNKELIEKTLASTSSTSVISSLPDLVFFKQTISNACGTIGLLHSLASNTDTIEIGDGPLKRLLDKSKDLTPDERAKVLEEDEELAKIHQSQALSGQTRVPGEHEDVNLHFTCFIVKNGTLYELDGRKPFPISHGPSTDLLQDATKVIKKEFMEREVGNLQFTVIALAPNQNPS